MNMMSEHYKQTHKMLNEARDNLGSRTEEHRRVPSTK